MLKYTEKTIIILEDDLAIYGVMVETLVEEHIFRTALHADKILCLVRDAEMVVEVITKLAFGLDPISQETEKSAVSILGRKI
ncbi:MAG: hypothetical protein M1824_006230 [Vezdaea acicularis]|nr:MAG: hypothetical protein M1824_006230 [Vezdaea acicularis]